MTRRPAADPTSALQLLDDIDAAARLAYLAADQVMYQLFAGTVDAARDVLGRHRTLLDARDTPSARACLEQTTAETMAWTPVVQQVHALALRWLTTATQHAGTVALSAPGMTAMLEDYGDAAPHAVRTGGPRRV